MDARYGEGMDHFVRGGRPINVRAIAAFLSGNEARALEILSYAHRRAKIVDEGSPLIRRLRFSDFKRSLEENFGQEVPFVVETTANKYAERGLHYFVNHELRLGGEPNCVLNIAGTFSAAIIRTRCDELARYHAAGLQLVAEENISGINHLFREPYRVAKPVVSKNAYVILTNGSLTPVDCNSLRQAILNGAEKLRERLARR